MKVALITIGKTDAAWVREAIEIYLARLKHYLAFDFIQLPDIKNSKNLSEEQQKQAEGEQILRMLQPGDRIVLLDDKGKSYTSMGFARYLEAKQHASVRRLVFIIGGPYGFSPTVYDKADERLSLSQMTFSHQMIRPIFLEQIYRAMTILRGEPYHHE